MIVFCLALGASGGLFCFLDMQLDLRFFPTGRGREETRKSELSPSPSAETGR
ncbi:MAG: hypothetical protein VB088_13695 [Sphaerochaeta sp.]|nr:hypothetical protein [Sphaerochaeta sp.]